MSKKNLETISGPSFLTNSEKLKSVYTTCMRLILRIVSYTNSDVVILISLKLDIVDL